MVHTTAVTALHICHTHAPGVRQGQTVFASTLVWDPIRATHVLLSAAAGGVCAGAVGADVQRHRVGGVGAAQERRQRPPRRAAHPHEALDAHLWSPSQLS